MKLPPEFLKLCKAVKAKRPRTVITHILKHGFITTQELKDKYGYNHPPRAVRDVKEHGIPIEMFRVVGSDGRKIAAYRFGDPKAISASPSPSGCGLRFAECLLLRALSPSLFIPDAVPRLKSSP